MPALEWHTLPFNDLSLDLLYAILGIRQRVFVVEQNIVY